MSAGAPSTLNFRINNGRTGDGSAATGPMNYSAVSEARVCPAARNSPAYFRRRDSGHWSLLVRNKSIGGAKLEVSRAFFSGRISLRVSVVCRYTVRRVPRGSLLALLGCWLGVGRKGVF